MFKFNTEAETNQYLLDHSARHLMAQGQPAKGKFTTAKGGVTDRCEYRTSEGRSCAVGCLFSEERYDPIWEGYTFQEMDEGEEHDSIALAIRDAIAATHSLDPALINVNLLAELQQVHDYYEPEDWRYELKRTALNNGLKLNV